jgi:NTP pyrophosphatase (non-canonical NTP hydrolase)
VYRVRRSEFLSAISDLAAEVYDFHERWGVEECLPDSAIERMRIRQPMLREEMRELDDEVVTQDEIALAEEATDVAFVAIGHLAALQGLSLRAVDTVVAKNAAKTGASHYINKETGKITRRTKSE